MKQESFLPIRFYCLSLIILVCMMVFSTSAAIADESGRDAFDKLLNKLYEDGNIPSMNGTVISYDTYVDDLAEMGFYQLTPLGESERFVISVHISWTSATKTPNPMNSGCGLFFQSEYGTSNHLMVSLRMDGGLYFSGSRYNKPLSFVRRPYIVAGPEGEADFVLISNGEHMKLFIDGEEVITKDDLPVMGNVFGLAVLSGTNKDFGIRCTGNDMFVYTW